MSLHKDTYRSETIRLRNWDYGSPGYYYVTICTRNRDNYFGDVVMCDCPGECHRYALRAAPWEGTRDGSVGTHNYASLHPTASPAQGSAVQAWDASHAVVRLTTIGEIAHQNWLDIPKHFPFVVLDESIVMPNHIHGILYFRKPGYRGHGPNSFGPQSENLGSVIGNYKGAIKAYATSHEIEFAWQARYHDDVIASRTQLDRVRAYIRNNPARWVQKETIKTSAEHERRHHRLNM